MQSAWAQNSLTSTATLSPSKPSSVRSSLRLVVLLVVRLSRASLVASRRTSPKMVLSEEYGRQFHLPFARLLLPVVLWLLLLVVSATAKWLESTGVVWLRKASASCTETRVQR